ncbi:hypothetical protein [Bradyrhizobium sp. 2S1]|uniref:hypothetical protein n=1 Tax=Bradyrhizobium sp. 2S1 TaxID=1404429 RepID=UPI0014073713|nr:hypothetical protein [Bradyrhizobium sp. 2S1]MCK7665026.1 hypothetical protein [Bradyrhizobium sp. 2S1]
MRKHFSLLLLLVLIAVGGLGGALAFSLCAAPVVLKHEAEWVRALLQVGLVGVLGIVTSVVIERFKESIQQQRDSSKLRHDIMTELSRSYMDVKLVRRRIQASRTFTNTDIDDLNRLQASVELHKRNSAGIFRRSSELKPHLRTMENYLNKVANKPASPEHSGFSSSGFDTFADAYEEAATLIREEIGGR